MLKEKLSLLLKTEKLGNKKKIENLVFLLVILIVTIIAINYIWNDKDKNVKQSATVNKPVDVNINDIGASNEEENLEKKLENILSKINGVGKADVMITYNESTQIIPVYNKKEKTSNTDESDSGGGKRKVEEVDSSEEVVYTDSTGKGEIVTQKTISPKIEGAIIICEGADNPSIKTSVIQAVEAATGIATHKIQVFKKQN